VEEKVSQNVLQVSHVEENGNPVSQVVEPGEPILYQVQQQQKQDPEIARLCSFRETKTLPDDPQQAKVISNLAKRGYFLVDNVLYYNGADAPDRCRVVVLEHLKKKVLEEHHCTAYVGYFSVKKMAQHVSQYFYWSGIKGDIYKKCARCVT